KVHPRSEGSCRADKNVCPTRKSKQGDSMKTMEQDGDGVERRGLLKCMAWGGTGVVWEIRGGILTADVFGAEVERGDFSFVQVSDSHIGFSKEPNKDVTGTLRLAVERINSLKVRPELLIHTGDLTHLSKAAEFDTVD